jgi:Zn-dependent protease
MTRSMTIGTIFGSDLRLHWSWPLLPVAAAIYSFAVFTWPEALFQVALLLAAYLCVMGREGVQLLAARRFGLGTRDLTLYPFWGVARLTRLSDRPWQENYIAATGPVFLALLATALGWGLTQTGRNVWAFPDRITEATVETFLVHLFWVNVLLTGFHCLPILPLDAGRIFRATLAMQVSRLRATEVAAALSTLVAAIILIAAIIWFHSPLMGVTAILLYLGAQEDLGTTRYFAAIRHERGEGGPAPAVMVPMDQIVTAECRPTEPNFNGFTWNARARLWIEWRDGQPVSANALIGDGRP